MPSKARLLAKSMIESPILSEITTNPTITPATITTAVNDVATGSFATVDLLPSTGNDVGDQAFVQATNRLYIWSGSGWYNIALINTTPTWDSNGQPAATYELSADSPQTATTITLAASDPEGFPITYSHVTGGSMDSIATINQDSSVFTITPKTSVQAPDGGTGSITFRATDGVNILPQVSGFTLNFITIVTNSKYTTLLATAVDISDNNNITDSSSNNHSITVNGDATAGTFSPHRSGGYATYFGNGGSERITVEGTKSTLAGANADFSIAAWIYPTAGNDKWIYGTNMSNNNQAGWHDLYLEGSTKLVWRHSDGSTHRSMMSTNPVSLNEWSYVLINRTSSVTYMYINGSLVAQNSDMTNALYTHTNAPSIGIRHFYDNNSTNLDFEGYITDVHVKTAAISSPTTVPTERAVADSDTWLLTAHLPYLGDGSSNNYTVSAYNNVFTKPFSPYDYTEYSAADHGGSVYFVGGANFSSQYLSLSGPTMPSGDFTLSTWAYLTSNGSDTTLIDFNGNSGGFRIMYMNNTSGAPYHFRFYTAGGTVYLYDSTSAHPLNQWHYIVVVRSSGTFKLYVNNKLMGTSTANPTFSSSNNVRIGQMLSGYGTLEGYLSDIIYNPTTAITDFTPPTAPLSSTGSELHIKGIDASIIDKSGSAALKLYGGAVSSTEVTGKFPNTNIIKVTGTSEYFTPTYSPVIGTSDYTIECWLYETIRQNYSYLFDYRPPNTNGDYLSLRLEQAQYNLYVGSSHTNRIVGGSSTWNGWAHFALARSGNQTKMFSNGTQVGNTWNASTNLLVPDNTPAIGRTNHNTYSDNAFRGYIQDFRITKGLARYTANFTPPTEPLEG